MAKYVAQNFGTQQNLTTTYVGSIVGLTGANAAPRRFKIYDLLIGTDGVPADNELEWLVSRVTTNSTATAFTPQPLDPADAAATTVATVNSSTAGTTGAGMFYLGMNQRASYRWVSAPGSELVSPATSSAGFQVLARSIGYTGTATATVYFEEQ